MSKEEIEELWDNLSATFTGNGDYHLEYVDKQTLVSILNIVGKKIWKEACAETRKKAINARPPYCPLSSGQISDLFNYEPEFKPIKL